jgi:hypothetical protein
LTRYKARRLIRALAWRTLTNLWEKLTAQDNLRALRSSLGRQSVAILAVSNIPSSGSRGKHT